MNKKNREWGKKNIRDYYNLTARIMKKGALTDRESAHLAVMFTDASSNILPKYSEIDNMFNKLLDLSIKHSKKTHKLSKKFLDSLKNTNRK
jgi:hypothetical protein